MPDLTTDPAAHNPEYGRQVAAMLAEAVRVLNHGTHPGNGCPVLQYPSDAYALIADLATAARRMPQLLEQISHFLAGWQANDRLADSRADVDPAVPVAAATESLRLAANFASSLDTVLQNAQNATSGLYVKEDPDAD